MKYLGKYLGGVLMVVTAAAAFLGGTRFGFHHGYLLGRYNDGLLRAETARRNLAAIEKGDVAQVAKGERTALRQGLLDHYDLMHYQRYGLLLPDRADWVFETRAPHTESFDLIFMRRIEIYATEHPQVMKLEDSGYDVEKLPESSDDEKALKAMMRSNAKMLDDELVWVLEHYAGK